MSELLVPEIATDPLGVAIRVGGNIISTKLQEFYTEYKRKKEIGEIQENIKTADSIGDILRFIQEGPDETRLEAVKKLFFISVTPGTPESEQQLIFELTHICKQLTSNDLLVLKASYLIAIGAVPTKYDRSSRSRIDWCRAVAIQIGHGIASLVEFSERHLEELKLITQQESRDSGAFFPAGQYRLTDLGYSLCNYLSEG